MNFLTRAAVSRLTDEGYILIAPGAPEPLPIYDLPSAVKFVQAAGLCVIHAKPATPPAIGQRWQPKRGYGVHGTARQLKPRWVAAVSPTEVSYALQQDGAAITVNMSTWDRWVRATRAEIAR